MPRYRLDRAGTWEYPSLDLVISDGDVVELNALPDLWFTEVAADTPTTVTAGAPAGVGNPASEPQDGSLLTYDAATNRYVPRLAADNGLLTEAAATGTYVAQADRLEVSGKADLYRWIINSQRPDSVGPVNVLVLGNSLAEGYNSSSIDDRFQSVFRRIAKERRPVAGQLPNSPPNYIPVRYQTSITPTVGWAITSGAPTVVSVGLGGRGYQFASGDSMTLTVECDYLDVCYQRTGSGSLSVVVDGGAPTSRSTSNNDDFFPLNVVNDPGNVQSHTVTVSWGSGSPVLCGAFVFQGDSGLGVRVFDAAHGGWKANDFVANLTNLTQAARLTWPHLAIVELGVNDYKQGRTSAAFEADLRTIISTITAAAGASSGTRPGSAVGTTTPSFLLLGMYEIPQTVATSAIEPWSNFLAAMKRVADDTADVAFLDLSKQMPPTDPATLGTNLYIADQTHLTTRGHRLVGGLLADVLVPPGGPADPAGREQKDIYRDAAKSLRTNHKFSAARYKSNGSLGTPTVAAAAGAGTTPPAPTLAAGSDDTAGTINCGTGTTPATGALATVTFATPYTSTPTVVVSKVGTNGSTVCVLTPSTTGFSVGFSGTAPAASQAVGTYQFSYVVIGH